MKRSFKVIVASVVLGAIALTAGCSGSKPATEAKPAAKEEAKQVTIRFSTWDSGDGVESHKAVIAAFEKKHPNIKVQLEAVPDNYTTKLLTQLASGTAADVIQIGDNDIRMFVDKGVVEDLSSYGVDSSIYYPDVYKTGVVNGKLYALTKDYTDLAIFYNKDHFDKAGVPYPKEGWTWNDFVETSKKLTKPEAKQWGVDIEPRAGRPLELWPLQNGSSLIADDGSKYSGFVNSKESVEAIQFFVDLFVKHKVAPTPAERDSMKGVDLFETGRVAMALTGHWPMDKYKKNTNLKFGVAPVPVGPKGKANVLLWAGFGINNKSQNKKEAAEFLKFIGGAEGAREYSKWGLPAVKSVADELGLSKDPASSVFLNDLVNVKKFGNLSSPYYSTPRGKYLNPALQEMIIKGANVKAKLDEVAPLMDAQLKELTSGK